MRSDADVTREDMEVALELVEMFDSVANDVLDLARRARMHPIGSKLFIRASRGALVEAAKVVPDRSPEIEAVLKAVLDLMEARVKHG